MQALAFTEKSAPLIKSARTTPGCDGGEVNHVRRSVTEVMPDDPVRTTAMGVVVEVKPVVLEAGAQLGEVLR
jgi:hypothetical protein